MRRRSVNVTYAVLIATTLVALGCGGTNQGGTGGPSRVTGKVGDTLKTADEYEQDGRAIEERLELTLLSVKDRGDEGKDDTLLEPGNRWLTARFRIRQLGPTEASVLSNQFAAADGEGQQFPGDVGDPFKPALTDQSNAIDLSPGESRTGFLAFQLPKQTRKVAKIQFRDSGFGPSPDVAEWRVTR